MSRRLFLGIDGGGTKTALCLADDEGTVLAGSRIGSVYSVGPDRLTHLATLLHEGMAAICRTAEVSPQDITFVFLGLPGFGEDKADVPIIEGLPRSVLGHDRYRCDNDTVCGWAGSLAGADGINVISGTGSITYGRRGGQGVRVGGWGEVFGDEGSGYWLGVRALQIFSQMSDGRAEPGPLLTILREHLNLDDDLDLVGLVINEWNADRTRIAALSRPLVEAARAGDRAAQSLIAEAGTELARLVTTTARRLGFTAREKFPVSYSGGVLGVHEVFEAFAHALEPVDCELRTPILSPVLGAVLHAAQLSGHPMTPAALENLRRSGA
ncbi:BadF/BadG/BcrA/BcrD ATPase family protein [Kineosporia sp. NBRC 101731]|uniref:N-acetylglucosamine kinase n=1 Tax=Kineosporia sp. NBRC 101731 TaxID=3032199 RepID=UPI0024A43BA8|nr:BadF/BadG/BcrA/BcrD ATPase family protein [Kineosporia sp. NBRC 101731]GLY29036.1 N-acetylglucosamine kinase [Kineosporia sp. NBRC 101731]